MRASKAEHDRWRGSARQRGYTTQWDKAATAFKVQHPLCCQCEREGRVTPTYAVDHIVPHRGDQTLFWDTTNWQPLCQTHHNRDKQRQENGHGPQALDVDGWPVNTKNGTSASKPVAFAR